MKEWCEAGLRRGVGVLLSPGLHILWIAMLVPEVGEHESIECDSA